MKQTLEEQMIHAAYWKDSEKVLELMALGQIGFARMKAVERFPILPKKAMIWKHLMFFGNVCGVFTQNCIEGLLRVLKLIGFYPESIANEQPKILNKNKGFLL